MKKKIFSILIILTLVFSISTVFATETENEEILLDSTIPEDLLTSTDDIENLVQNSLTKLNNNGEGNQVIADATVFLKDDTVDGNLVIFGRNVNIENLSVDGDVSIFAETINISDLTINNGITVIAGQNICLNTVSTKGNIYVACENVVGNVNAKGFFAAAGDVKLTGETQVSRVYNYSGSLSIDSGNYEKVEAGIGELYIGPNVKINEGLKYSSENEGNISESANISNIDFTKAEKKEVEITITPRDIVISKIIDVVTIIVKALIVCGFIFLCANGFIEKTKVEDSVKYLGLSILKGLGLTIIIPIISLILMFSGVAIGVAFVILAIYIIILWASLTIVSIAIMNAIIKDKQVAKKKAYGITILVAFVLAILGLVPVLGGIVKTLVAFAGMGIFIGALKTNNKTNVKDNNSK